MGRFTWTPDLLVQLQWLMWGIKDKCKGIEQAADLNKAFADTGVSFQVWGWGTCVLYAHTPAVQLWDRDSKLLRVECFQLFYRGIAVHRVRCRPEGILTSCKSGTWFGNGFNCFSPLQFGKVQRESSSIYCTVWLSVLITSGSNYSQRCFGIRHSIMITVTCKQ